MAYEINYSDYEEVNVTYDGNNLASDFKTLAQKFDFAEVNCDQKFNINGHENVTVKVVDNLVILNGYGGIQIPVADVTSATLL